MAQYTVARKPTSNDGTGWTNRNNAHADDGVYATASPAQNGNVQTKYGNFGFDSAIPTGSAIDAVKSRVEYKVSTQASIATQRLVAVVGGVNEPAHQDASEPLSDTTVTFVLTADRSWTRANLLNGTLELVSAAIRGNSGTAVTFSVDYIEIEVTYTPPNQTVTPAAVAAVASVSTPTLILGSVAVTPAALVAASSVPAPTILLGARTVEPAAVVAAASVAAAQVVLGAVTLAPASVTATAAAPAPILLLSFAARPAAIAAAATVATPLVALGVLTVAPAATIAAATVAAPIVVGGAVPEPDAENIWAAAGQRRTLAAAATPRSLAAAAQRRTFNVA